MMDGRHLAVMQAASTSSSSLGLDAEKALPDPPSSSSSSSNRNPGRPMVLATIRNWSKKMKIMSALAAFLLLSIVISVAVAVPVSKINNHARNAGQTPGDAPFGCMLIMLLASLNHSNLTCFPTFKNG